MDQENSGLKTWQLPSSGRRDVLVLAAASAGVGVLGCSDGDSQARAGLPGASHTDFIDPATAAEYLATMHLGTQAGDYLEMPDESAGVPHEVFALDFDNIREDGKFDHVRIPANCAARADVNGLISEPFLVKIDAQIDMALARFERVILDPLHHYLQWKGDHAYDRFFDDYVKVAQLTADQHAVRATAIWLQLATRYKDVSSRLSFDLFNEPEQVAQQAGYPLGLTVAQLNAWHATVIPVIRKSGGVNTGRMIWLEPHSNRIEMLAIPVDAGPIGVSPHYYTPYDFTSGPAALTAGGMADYVEDIKYAKQWSGDNKVPVWIGESGVSLNVNGSHVPRPPEERAEFMAHIRNTGAANLTPICYWCYNSDFALYDQLAHVWLPGVLQAVSGLPTPLPVRTIPSFIVPKGGRMAKLFDPTSIWSGFSFAPETGVLTAAANDSGVDHNLIIVFPDISVAGMQSWVVRAAEFSGDWRIGTAPFFYNSTEPNKTGQLGLDHRALDNTGQSIYPRYRQLAPGGFDNPYGPISSADTFLGIELVFNAGSPAGHMTFECLRTV